VTVSTVTCEISGTGLRSSIFSSFTSSMTGTDSAPSDIMEVTLSGISSMGDTGSMMVGIFDLAVFGRVVFSSPPSWLPSSAASWIQLSFCCRDEPDEDELEGAAVCSVQAAVRAASLSSSGVEMLRTKSCGANRSVMVMK
jgi:hypothetical protein